jgi:hypothetical protein
MDLELRACRTNQECERIVFEYPMLESACGTCVLSDAYCWETWNAGCLLDMRESWSLSSLSACSQEI